MKLISKYLIIIVAVVGFANVLPSLYNTTFSKSTNFKFVRYSPIIHDFVYMQMNNKNKRTYHDFAGNEYSEREYMKLLPFLYYSNLELWGEVPETVNGELIDAMSIRRASDFIRISADDIDYSTNARIKLYPLFESAGNTADIPMPDEVFRMSDRMEFISTITNTVEEEKSALFTNALKEKGFVFPPKIVAGNETTRKPFDFGYFVVDANNKLYHMYQVEGQPKIVNAIAPDDSIAYIIVSESHFPYYGLLVTDNGTIYRISTEDYRLDKVYVEGYNPKKHFILYQSDLQNITVTLRDGNTDTLFVSDLALKPVDKVAHDEEKRISGLNKTIYDSLFPFVISHNRYTANGLPILTISSNLTYAIIFSIILSIGYVAIMRRKATIGEVVSILIGGIYSLIVVVLLNINKFKKMR